MKDRKGSLSEAKDRLAEGVGFAIGLTLVFILFHFIDGSRPLIPEFEAGGITGVVMLKLMEAGRAALREDTK